MITGWHGVRGRVERGSFTLTLSQNRAWKSPLTRLFTLNVLCIDIIWGSDLSVNDRKDCGLCPLSLAANWKPWQWACDGSACISCVPNRQAPCSGGSSLWQTRSCQTCCSNCTNLALGSQSLLLPVGVSSQDGNVFDKPDEQWWTRSVIAMARKHLQSECSFHSFIFSCSFFTDFLLMAGRKFVKHWPCFRFHDLRHRKV